MHLCVNFLGIVLWNEIFESQALIYLRLTNLKFALVMNFGEKFVKDGIHRLVRIVTDGETIVEPGIRPKASMLFL